MNRQWKDKILAVSRTEMDDLALEIFQYQYTQNPVYRQYADALGKTPSTVDSIYQIPFLPIRFFKSHAVQNGSFEPEVVFESSGTTGSTTSRHYIKLFSPAPFDCSMVNLQTGVLLAYYLPIWKEKILPWSLW